MSGLRHWEQDKDSTLYVGNLDERCTDALVWELMTQAGVVVNVHLPKDRVTQIHQGYGFVEFASEDDADYAAKIMNQIRLHGKPIRVNKASADKRGGVGEGGLGGGAGVGAEVFVGNLDSMVDEKVLFETFSRFGPLIAPPKIARDESNLSKGYGFVSYASFEASDDAIANMHGQYLMNKEITVQYAYKKDGKGERHGDAAERALAAQAKAHGVEVAIPAMPAALVMPTPSAPPAPDFSQNLPSQRPPQAPPAYNYAFPGNWQPPPGGPPMGAPPSMPPIAQRQYNQSPLQAAPGLPPRPPPSMAGYGGPMNAPGMNQGYHGLPGHLPPGLPPGMPPAGLPPAGPPGMLPPGLPPPPVGGFRPPGLPNGFPPPGQQR